MKKLGLILFLLIGIKMHSQTKFILETQFGKGFNKEIQINGEKISDYNAYVIQFGAHAQIPLHKQLFLETGIDGKYYYSSGTMRLSDYDVHELKIGIPLYLGYHFSPKWLASSGVSVSNNKDFDEFNFKESHNLRWDYVVRTNYQFYKKWGAMLQYQNTFSTLSNSGLLSVPNSVFSVGFTFQIN